MQHAENSETVRKHILNNQIFFWRDVIYQKNASKNSHKVKIVTKIQPGNLFKNKFKFDKFLRKKYEG